MSDPERPQRRFAGLRSSFLTGLVVILPIWATGYLIWLVTGWIDSWVLPVLPDRLRPETFVGFEMHGIGVIIFLVFTVAVGWIAKGLLGRSLIRLGEGIVARMPIVRSVYNALKQIAETVFAQSDSNFDRACLMQYPRQGIWAIGFVSTRAKGEVAGALGGQGPVLSVFLPTTPNPTSGFLLFIPESEVIYLEMSVEDAAKLIISAGLVYPNPKDPSKPLPKA